MMVLYGYGDDIEKSLRTCERNCECRMNVKETHNRPLKHLHRLRTAIYEDGWINVHPRRECAQNGSGRAYTAMCDFDRDTRSAYEMNGNMTGYESKSRRQRWRKRQRRWISEGISKIWRYNDIRTYE